MILVSQVSGSKLRLEVMLLRPPGVYPIIIETVIPVMELESGTCKTFALKFLSAPFFIV